MGHFGKKVVECAGIALTNNGRVFLIRPLFNGIVQQYGFPKGHVEKGETPQEAAVREFTEETGINILGKKTEYLGYVFAKIDDETNKKVIIYRVNGDGSEKFKCANIAENGEPENLYGCYIPYERAYDLITTYQQPIIKTLIKNEYKCFESFFKNNFSNEE